MWAAVREPAKAQPIPTVTLTVSGMNDVLNSQGYTQAAWLNRIPVMANVLMMLIAMFGNLMFGFASRNPKSESRLLLVLPLVVSVAFFLIMDIDSSSGGIIRVYPQNLISLAESLRGGAKIVHGTSILEIEIDSVENLDQINTRQEKAPYISRERACMRLYS